MRSSGYRPRIVVLVVMGVLSLAAPVSAGPMIDLPRLDIAYDYDPPIESHGYWAGDPAGGEWRVVGSRLGRGGRLTLEVEARPPAISVPLESGPAVLFGRLQLYGGLGGDVGVGARVKRVIARVLPACPDPTDCVYRGSITLPTHLLPALAERRRAESWNAAVIGLTLVRTFAQGTWIQVLPLYDELRDEPDGTVGHPRRIRSQMLVLGASPVGPRELWSRRDRAVLDRVERLRRSIDDPSRLPDTQPLLVDIETAPCTPGWTIATATGDTLIDVTEQGPSVPIKVEAPVGAEWMVSVPSIDRAQGTGDPARTFGPFRSDVPGLVSGWVSGDRYLCQDLEPGSVAWRPASADDLASFAVPASDDALSVYATLPAEIGGPTTPSATPSSAPVEEATPRTEMDWGPLAVVSASRAGDAGFGPVTLSVGSECVTAKGDQDEEAMTLVWPEDASSWRPAKRRIVFENPQTDMTRLSEGDRVTFGGMPLEPDATAQLATWFGAAWVQPPDPSCPTSLWLVGEVQVLDDER